MPDFHWGQTEVADLTRLWASDNSALAIATEMARKYGVPVSRSAILGKASRIGLPNRPYAENDPRRHPSRKGKPASRQWVDAPAAITLKRPPKAPEVVIVAPPPSMKALMALKADDCRFPIGDPHLPGFGFCGAPKGEGSQSYCQFHHRLCFTPPPERDKAKRSGFVLQSLAA